MHRNRLAILVVGLVALAGVLPGVVIATETTDGVQSTCDFPVSAVDATGTEVTLEERPERIVTLQPSTAQVAWEIGIWDRVVGAPVGEYIAYLDGYDEPEDVTESDDLTPVTERIVDLEPDLVLAAGVQDDERIDHLREAGVTVFKSGPTGSIEELYDEIRLTGTLTGECDGAEETVEWMRSEIALVEEAVGGEDRPVVFYAMGSGFTAGEGTFTDEIISAAGGENFGTMIGVDFYEQVSDEVLVQEDPEWIVYPDAFDEPPVEGAAIERTTAWQTDQIVVVDSNYMNQPGPRIVYSIQLLAEAFHPEAFAAAHGVSDEPNIAEDPTDVDAQPGFGIVVVLVSLLVIGSFARFR